MLKPLTEKHCIINHTIVFDDPVSKFDQCSIWGFCWGYLWFLVSASAKRNAEVTKFLGISENKINFRLRKKSKVSLNKKVIFVLHAVFKLDFITHIIYCIIHRGLCSHLLPFCSLISFSKEKNFRNNVNLFLFIQSAKVKKNKMNEKEARSNIVWTMNM